MRNQTGLKPWNFDLKSILAYDTDDEHTKLFPKFCSCTSNTVFKEWLSFSWNSENIYYTYSSKENQTNQVFITADNFVL